MVPAAGAAAVEDGCWADVEGLLKKLEPRLGAVGAVEAAGPGVELEGGAELWLNIPRLGAAVAVDAGVADDEL